MYYKLSQITLLFTDTIVYKKNQTEKKKENKLLSQYINNKLRDTKNTIKYMSL